MPVMATHMHFAQDFLWTWCALVQDVAAVELGFVLSTEPEAMAFRDRVLETLSASKKCVPRWRAAAWEAVQAARDGSHTAQSSQATVVTTAHQKQLNTAHLAVLGPSLCLHA